MINITNSAQLHFYKLLVNQKRGTQIRVFVINPGTPDAECGVSYCPPDSVKSNDIKLIFDKINVYVDKFSAPYLHEAEIDLITDNLGSQLTLKAPNSKIHKTSKDYSLFVRIENILQYKINPKLAAHGGKVILIKIINKHTAVLNFLGGCNGCSMANNTLKEKIEKQLLKECPELKKVIDQTNHQHGIHSYY